MPAIRSALVVVLAACSSSSAPMKMSTPDAGAPCSPTGLLHAQPLMVGALERHYMLYVPSSYACDGPPLPLLIDFHGTWAGQESDNGEEFYALDGLMAEADAYGVIVARPRSLFSDEGGENVYRWDENPGDYTKNAAFAHALVTELESLYRIDPARVYAAGFSSGTGMAAQFFADDPQVFHGYAFVGGGFWSSEPPSAVHLDPAPRMYAVSGYRDYLYAEQQVLRALLAAHDDPTASFFQRTDTNGHELYGWHYREMFAWLDAGMRPDAGVLAPEWQAETVPGGEDLTALASDGAGGLVAVGGSGGIYQRDAMAGWSKATTIANAPGLSGVCVLASGEGVAVGEAAVAHTADHGATWTTDVQIPAFVAGYYPTPYMTAVGCTASELVSVGYWNAANSADASTWLESDIPETGAPAYSSQGAQVKASAAGTWIASGYYDYLGRSTDGVTFTGVEPPTSVQWLMGIAPGPSGHWWVAGEAGTVLASADDGVTWTAQTVPTTEDLYAIAFYDAQRGIAVGAHGAAIVTTDGGQTWTARSTGLDAYLGDAVWLDANTALVVGGVGTAATLHVD